MTKKLFAVVLTVVMLFACALPAFAMTEEIAKAEVAAKIWLADDTTEYTITDVGTYHQVIAVDHGVTYEFHVKNTDGVMKLAKYEVTGSGILSFVGSINGFLLTIASMFVAF